MLSLFDREAQGNMWEQCLDACIDTLKTIPFLLVVYFCIEVLEHKWAWQKALQRSRRWEPLMGALVGCIPQCGFSAAGATLYNAGALGSGTLIAIFLATSDEALPVLLSSQAPPATIGLLIGCKLVVAVVFGYLFSWTVFRSETVSITPSAEENEHTHPWRWGTVVKSAVLHTIQIACFMLVCLCVINLALYWIGEQALSKLLLANTILQPFLTALIGLVPGCATSVLLTELWMQGAISFGAAIAGLSTGAGFGYLILFRQSGKRRKAAKVLLCTYLAAVCAGVVIQWLF